MVELVRISGFARFCARFSGIYVGLGARTRLLPMRICLKLHFSWKGIDKRCFLVYHNVVSEQRYELGLRCDSFRAMFSVFVRVCLKKENPQVRVDFSSVQGRNPKA